MFPDAPKDYRAPYWANLSRLMERKHGLPEGLLVGIIQRGERSNADAVSEAGARTPFQIIPATRRAIEQKYGIDPYLSPRTAAEGAALLLKESLERNRGNVAAAVAEYHGGTDRANWGKRTRAYVERVTQGDGRVTLAGVRAARGDNADAPPRKEPLAKRVADALAGKNGPEARAAMLADIREGRVIPPRGVEVPADVTAPRPVTADEIEAYQSGRMSLEERAALKQDIDDGFAAVPAGTNLEPPERPGLIAGLVEAVTGRARATPETEALPDWIAMPEAQNFRTMTGAIMPSSNEELAQIIVASNPGVTSRQDAKGNFILFSPSTGREFAVKPGLQISDVPRIGAAVAAFSPAGAARTVAGAAGASALTQAAVEGTQAATGGTFDPGEVVLAGALGGAVPVAGRVLQAAKPAVVGAVERIRGRPGAVAGAADSAPMPPPVAAVAPDMPPAAAVADDVPLAAAPEPVAPPAAAVADDALPRVEVPPVSPEVAEAIAANADDAARAATGGAANGIAAMTPEQLASVARAAANGKTLAADQLAAIVKVNPEAEALARQLGVEVPVDVLSDNVQFVTASGLARARIGGPEQSAWAQTLEDTANRFDDLLRQMDGTTDAAGVSERVLGAVKTEIDGLEAAANKIRSEVDAAIPKASRVDPQASRQLMDETVAELGGKAKLRPAERDLLRMVKDEGGPTYARLIRERQDIGKAIEGKGGAYADVNTALLKRLYGALAEDQMAHVRRVGGADLAEKLAASNKIYTRMFRARDVAVARFGKDMDGSLVPKMRQAISGGSKGDIRALRSMIAAVPEPMRKETVATAIMSMARQEAGATPWRFDFNSFAKTWAGIRANQPVYNTIKGVLGPEATGVLDGMAAISQRINRAQNAAAVSRTGASLQGFVNELKVQGLLQRAMSSAASRMAVAGAGAVTGGPAGAGLAGAVSEMVARAPSTTLGKVNTLLNSQEFKDMAVQAATRPEVPPATIRRVANSSAFARFWRDIGEPRDMAAKERWLLAALQAENQFDAATQVPEQQQ